MKYKIFLLLALLPTLSQLFVSYAGDYWYGLLFRLITHIGVPLAWFLLYKESLLKPLRQKPVLRPLLFFSGIAFFAILLGFFSLLPFLDFSQISANLAEIYTITPLVYLLIALAIVIVNPFIEEYFWRLFIYGESAQRGAGLWIGALFAVHHIVIFSAWASSWTVALAAVFLAAVGVWFNWLYKKFGFWTCFAVHAAADLAIILAGIVVLF